MKTNVYRENGAKNSLAGWIKSKMNLVKHDISFFKCSYLNDCICISNEDTMTGLIFEFKWFTTCKETKIVLATLSQTREIKYYLKCSGM